MITFIQGNIDEINPNFIVINCNGVGYKAQISLMSFKQFQTEKPVKVLTELIIREDAHLLFGFSTSEERVFFKLLISVNGVGPVAAMMMLSTLSLEEIAHAIGSGNSGLLQKVKGIGLKTAQRIIIDLRDKVSELQLASHANTHFDNSIKNEALSALEVLGISKKMTEKHIDKIIQNDPNIQLEDLIKQILQSL